jgi:prevent-host-death family protein
MKIVNMHEAKTHLSKLVAAAAKGEPFVIARAGKPLVKVAMIEMETPRRTGFLKGRIDVPEDFDTMGAEEIRAMFEGKYDAPPEGAA